ncbi:hypothetical protein [Sphingomonas abaci]|uniref:Uncharacterized protein n=1 Tax=Sphingomonas abaci TaxID=237611 RepID=A0A7W7APR5_9SPHN|nr:hypothetical protein [Sphingomonas abaci]MBB4619979.1 hypothetical protein [Sphingomonas abaci]
MAFNPTATLAANDVEWQQAIANINAQNDADEAELDAIEATIAALEREKNGNGLQAPIPNPVTALTVGPEVTTGTGWKNLGATEHSFRAEPADPADTGSMSAGGEVIMFANAGVDMPDYAFKVTGLGGSQYLNFFYAAGGAWVQFSGGESNHNFGRVLTRADVTDVQFQNGTAVVLLNGVAVKTFPPLVFQSKFPDGLGGFAKYTRLGGNYTQKITLSGGVIAPMTAITIALDADGRALFTFDYKGTSPGYVGGIFDTADVQIGALKPATLIENAKKGRATYLSADAAPSRNTGYVFKLFEADSTGNPKAGVVPISATLLMPSPLRIGQNIVFSGNPYFTNLALNAGWQDTSDYSYKDVNQGYVGDDGNLTGFPVGASYNLRCGKPAYGQNQKLHEISWIEPNNTTGVSRFNVVGTTLYLKRWTSEQAITYVNGRFVYRGIPNVNMDGTNPDELWISFVGKTAGGQTQDIRLAEATADSSKRARESWNTSMNDPLHGVIRTMESQQINYWRQNYSWAERPRPGYRPYANSLMGFPLEDHIAMSRRNGRPLMFILGPRWPAEVVQKSVRALFTGEGMADGLALRPDTHVYLSLVGNEHFNFNFTGLYEELVAAAERDYGYTAGGNNEKRIYSSVQIHNRNYDLVRAAIPEFMNRVTIIYSCSPGNHVFEWGKAKGFGIRGVQAIETSIYVGIGVKKTSYGNNTPAELLGPWLGDADKQVDAALLGFNDYAKEGLARLLYEVGMDIFGSFQQGTLAMTDDQRKAWVTSAEYMQVYRRAMNRIRNEFGSEMALYYDNGNMDFWGHWNPGVATPKWDLMLEIQAAVEAGR